MLLDSSVSYQLRSFRPELGVKLGTSTYGCRRRAREDASFFNRSTTSSVALFIDDALDRPNDAECESRALRSSTKTDADFPVDFFFAS